MTPPCQCSQPGYCSRFGRPMKGKPYDLCAGIGVSAQVSEKFRANMDAATRGEPPAGAQAAAAAAGPDQAEPPPTPEETAEAPTLLQMGLTYLREWRAWRKAGKPLVSAATRAQRRDLCLACPQHEPVQDRCLACGCYLVPTILGDALAWSTKQCPANPPRWLAELPPESAGQ